MFAATYQPENVFIERTIIYFANLYRDIITQYRTNGIIQIAPSKAPESSLFLGVAQ